MTLRVDTVRLPTGVEIEEYHVAEYPDWVCVLALTPDGDAVLVEQYRYGIDRVSLEFAAGAIDGEEAPLAAARRELLEETGYASDAWEAVGRLAVEPSRHTNWAHLFVARGARRVAAPTPDATEDLVVRLVPAASLAERVDAGEIVHGVHAALVYRALGEGWIERRAESAAGELHREAPVHALHSPTSAPLMATETKTLLVTIDTDVEEDARLDEIGAKVGDGWTVIQAIAVSGGELGSGGISESFARYQVTVERELDADGAPVGIDTTKAARLADSAATALFDDGVDAPADED